MPGQTVVDVTVTYDIDPATGRELVLVNPDVLAVGEGDIIRFRRAGRMKGTMRVTFAAPQFFRTGRPEFATNGVFLEGDGDVEVTSQPTRTAIKCELIDQNGRMIAQSLENGGAAVEPETRRQKKGP